jgi:hypothetical protein
MSFPKTYTPSSLSQDSSTLTPLSDPDHLYDMATEQEDEEDEYALPAAKFRSHTQGKGRDSIYKYTYKENGEWERKDSDGETEEQEEMEEEETEEDEEDMMA